MNAFCNKQNFEVSWYLKNLKTGEKFNRNGDTVIYSGSVRKIAILMSALNDVKNGKISLDKKTQIQKRYKRNASGCFRHLKSEFSLSFQDILTMMIIISDNTCTGIVVDTIGKKRINSYCESIGMKNTEIKGGFPPLGKEHLKKYRDKTTPNDIGFLLNSILDGSKNKKIAAKIGCTPKLCRLAIDIMKRQELRTRLPLFLPNNAEVAHKTGTMRGVFNDAGIIFYRNSPQFILSVFVHNGSKGFPKKEEADLVIGKLCRMCYDYIKKIR